jgi:hypothetical protein
MQEKDLLKSIRGRFTEKELLDLAHNMIDLGPELQDMISEYFIKLFENSNAVSYKTLILLMTCDLEEVPLYINHLDAEIRAIANWRLRIAK